jgi:hypothetical protein
MPDVIKDALYGLLAQGQVRSHQRASEEFFSRDFCQTLDQECAG